MCVTPATEAEGVVGGDTSLHFFDGAKTFNTTTTGSGILFRKDLEHEGLELTKGHKHIITANIWATRIEQSKQVLLVTFPQNEKVGGNSSSMDTTEEDSTFDKQAVLAELQSLKVKELKVRLSEHKVDWSTMVEKGEMVQALADSMEVEFVKSKNEEYIKKAANECASYALPVDILSGMLLTHVEWANRAAEQEGKDEPAIVTYVCQDYDYDTFGIVEKILNRSYVDENSILAARDCLDFFGPFKYENMLVDLSLESAMGKENESSSPDKKKARKEKTSKDEDEDEAFDMDIITCETEARARVVANVAAALDEPYVPFKILFVEGVMEANCEGDCSIVEVPMMAVACLLGDHDNVLFLRNVCTRHSVSAKTFQEIHSESNVFVETPSDVMEAILSGVSSGGEVDLFDRKHGQTYEVTSALKKNGYGLGLKVGLRSPRDIKSEVVDACLNSAYDMLPHGSSTKTVYLPGLDTEAKQVEDDGTSLFHRNSKGEVVFTEKEAERASDFIASTGIEDCVKASLQKKRFVLPQQTSRVQANFCNENVYGNLNVLWVSGVIRMKNTAGKEKGKVAAAKEEFDAWPSERAKANINSTRTRLAAQHAMGGFFW